MKPEWRDAIVLGPVAATQAILTLISGRKAPRKALRVAFDGWYGIDWPAIVAALQSLASQSGLTLSFRPILSLFKSRAEIAAYKRAFTETDDPGFGVVNTDGHLAESFPGLFPMDVWLDDGYFPKPTPAERISMPIHNHPSTDYVRSHFKEPLGRYETYYIAEAYEGANTWMGYREEADLEEWERLCREAKNLKEIPNWKEFIANWDTNVGDLFLIPPGTTHGHGGNQMVLEMDTCPSIAATEYSFFLYDFARHSWDDQKKAMTGKPCNMHLEHGFDNEKWCRESWVKDHLRARPVVVKWTQDYQVDRYSSDPRMPFEIERLHFSRRADNDTTGKFMHIVTLTVGNQVTLRSKAHPDRRNSIRKWQSALVPACFGEYAFVNDGEGQCTVVQLRWKQG